MSVTVTQELTQQTVTVTGNPVENNVTVTVSNARGPSGGGGSATWGGITGTLSAQTDLQTALNLKAPLASPALTGTPTAPTAATTTSTTQVATTAFVQQELASGVAVAKNLEFLAHNGSGATIAKGSIVYINGAVGGVPRITKSQANNDTNSARTIGFVKADIANGANGFVIIEGELLNVSTADSDGIIGAGIQLYLSPTTPGAFTRTKPSAPNHLVYVGVVVTASTGANLDGEILVGIQNGYELNEIHDVSITSPAAGQVIKRNAGNTLWINSAIVSADVSDATDAATPSTLVRRNDNGAAQFVELTVTGGTTFGGESLVQFDALEYYYGTGAASAHRTALGSGATGDALFTAANAGAARTTLGLATTDAVTFASVMGSTRVSGTAVNSATFTETVLNADGTAAGNPRSTLAGGRLSFRNIGGVAWTSSASSTSTQDLAIGRASAGVLEINSGTAADYRDMLARNITASGFIATTPATRSGPGALSVTASSIALTTTGVADALTLANGTNGQILTVCHVSRGGGTGTAVLTPTTKNGYTTITFTATGDSVTLQYHTTGGWHIIGSHGVTIA